MKIATISASYTTTKLFIIIVLCLIIKSNNYGQDRKESSQRQDIIINSWMQADQTEPDSVLQILKDRLNIPDAFFDNSFSGTANSSHFFSDPFISRKWQEWPDKDFFYFAPTDSIYNFVNPLEMRTLLQNHQRMMKELQKYFEFKLPHKQLNPDSVLYYHFKGRKYIPIKTSIKNQKI